MAYSKTTWANGTTPAINAANLNKIEEGIYDASNEAATIKKALTLISGELPIGLAVTNNGYYNNDGNLQSNANYQYAILRYNGADKIYVTTNATSASRIAVYFNGSPSSSTKIGTQDAAYPDNYGTLSVTDFELTIPNGTKYIVINNQVSAGTMSAKRNTVEYEKEVTTGLINEIASVKSATDTFEDITYKLTIQEEKYYSNYGVLSENYSYENAVISVSSNDIFKISTAGNSVAPCILYFSGTPSQNTLVSYEPTSYPASYGTKVIEDYQPTIPASAQYMVVNNKRGEYTMKVIKKSTLPIADNLISYQKKNILLLGDSITQLGMSERGWVKYFSQIVKPARVDNVAVIGAHLCDYNDHTIYNGNPVAETSEQNVVGNQVQKIINNPSNYASNYDVIIIAAGTNDDTSTGQITTSEINAQFFSGSSIVSLSNVDRSTWVGATRWITEKLRELYPTAKIVFNTPIHRIDLHNSSRVLNNGSSIKICADANSVLLCDSLKCGVTMSDEDDFIDSLHPSVQGAEKLGKYNAKFFASMFKGYVDE